MYNFNTDVNQYAPFSCKDLVQQKVYVPDFGQIGELYKQGFNNEIDLALQKPQYRGLVNAHLGQVETMPSPGLDDDTLLETMPSREYDVNELREIAIHNANEYQKTKDDKK